MKSINEHSSNYDNISGSSPVSRSQRCSPCSTQYSTAKSSLDCRSRQFRGFRDFRIETSSATTSPNAHSSSCTFYARCQSDRTFRRFLDSRHQELLPSKAYSALRPANSSSRRNIVFVTKAPHELKTEEVK